ncbi:MAG: hypothetical protein ACI92S_001855 [Planctomycetaceae bacterium]|jgi:hypothetical protein
MRLSVPTNWALPFRSASSRRRKLGRVGPRVAAESVETRCLLSATTPLSEIVWADDCNVEYDLGYDLDSAIYESDYFFNWAPIEDEYAFDLTFDATAFVESIPEWGWDTSQSWLEGDFWFDGYEEIRDSFQAAIDGTFNGFIDSIWYEDSQTIEYIGDVIYLTLESASGDLLPVDIFVAGGNAETVLTTGASVLQQVEQLLVAPENNLFDTDSDLQVFDVSVNLFQYNDGTSDQLVIDSYEIFREDFSSPGFLQSEFVIVDNFDLGTEFIVEQPILDIFGDEELFAITDLPTVEADEGTQVIVDELPSELDEPIVADTELGDAATEVESLFVSDPGEPSLEQESVNVSAAREASLEREAPTESDLSADNVREADKSQLAEKRAHRTVAERFNRELREKQEAGRFSKADQSTAEHSVDVDSEGRASTTDVPSQASDRWQRLRRQAALAAQQIAASSATNHLSAFQHTGIVPATTGSLALNWGATVAAFAHSALEDQLQGLTTAETDNEQPEESAEQMTYAQVASATGTMLIGATAVFQAIRKRRQTKLQRRWGTGDSIHEKDTRHNFSTNNAPQSPQFSRSTVSELPAGVDQPVRFA